MPYQRRYNGPRLVCWHAVDKYGSYLYGANNLIDGKVTDVNGYGSTLFKIGKALNKCGEIALILTCHIEDFVQQKLGFLKKNTNRYLVNGRNRIPDFFHDGGIHEIKNVKLLSFTSQLRDYVDLSKEMKLGLYIHVRGNTDLSGPIKAAHNDGLLTIIKHEELNR